MGKVEEEEREYWRLTSTGSVDKFSLPLGQLKSYVDANMFSEFCQQFACSCMANLFVDIVAFQRRMT